MLTVKCINSIFLKKKKEKKERKRCIQYIQLKLVQCDELKSQVSL